MARTDAPSPGMEPGSLATDAAVLSLALACKQDRATRIIRPHGDQLTELERLELVGAAEGAGCRSITTGIPATTHAAE